MDGTATFSNKLIPENSQNVIKEWHFHLTSATSFIAIVIINALNHNKTAFKIIEAKYIHFQGHTHRPSMFSEFKERKYYLLLSCYAFGVLSLT